MVVQAPAVSIAARSLSLALLLCAALPAVGHAQDDWWGQDKAKHYGVSAALTVGGHALSALWLEQPWQRGIAGASLGLGAGIAKELHDLAGYGDPSWKDLTWDLAGVVTGAGLALLVDILWLDRGAEAAVASAPATPMALRVRF